MKRAALLSISIFIVAAAVYLLQVKKEAVSTSITAAAPSVATATASPAKTAAPRAPLPPPGPNVAPAFTEFLARDSKLLESMHVDANAAEARENQIAAQMGEAEVEYAHELVVTPTAPANERILAMDLLGRASPRLTGSALDDIITRAMNSARAAPHTVDELSNVQAKSFALMGVDKIVERAATDPTERDRLRRLAAQAPDSTVKRYIEDQLKKLPSP